MPTMTEKAYYTVEEVAEELRVKPITVLRYIRREELRAYRIGKVYRIHASDLRRFMESRRTDNTEKTES